MFQMGGVDFQEESATKLSLGRNPGLFKISSDIVAMRNQVLRLCQMLSPQIVVGDNKVPFLCLHNLICNGLLELKIKENDKVYLIEIARMVNLLRNLGVSCNSDDIITLATNNKTLKKFSY